MIIMSLCGAILHERGIRQLLRRTMRKVWWACLFAILVATIATPGTSAQAAPREVRGATFRYFPATGHNLGEPFLTFYEAHGGESILGQPLTEPIDAGEIQVQYFEQARIERRDLNITLSLLGSAVTAGRGEPAFAQLAASPTPDRRFYAQTGHTLGGAFDFFWQSNGGLPIFGFPISEEFIEDGALMQYFERGRFEYHPDTGGRHVRISALGEAYARLMGVTNEQFAPSAPIVRLSAATIAIHDSAYHNVALAAEKINGTTIAPGASFSFLRTIGEVSRRTGYTEGQAIVDSRVGTIIGGGICYVSTAIYRAAFLAGLPITERRPHSIALASLNDIPGFDSAVDTRGPDLRWRNDTPHTITIAAELRAGQLTITLWGLGDGRSTTMQGPKVKKDSTTQNVTIGRVIRAAGGALIRKETVKSRYRIAEQPKV